MTASTLVILKICIKYHRLSFFEVWKGCYKDLFVSSLTSLLHFSSAFSTAILWQNLSVVLRDQTEISPLQARRKFGKSTAAEGNTPALLVVVLVATVFQSPRSRHHRWRTTELTLGNIPKRLALEINVPYS